MSIQKAVWIMSPDGAESPFFRKHFQAEGVKSAVIDICGLGWFELYINGVRSGENLFEPAVSTYERINGKRLGYPLEDVFKSPRVYYCRHDITDLVKNGENLISVHLGNGWFNQHRRNCEGDFALGCPRLAFSLKLEYENGEAAEILSDTTVKCGKSHVTENNVYFGETQNFSLPSDFHAENFDESALEAAAETKAPEGELTLYKYPADRVIRAIKPKLLGKFNGKYVYDAGENIAGRVVFDTDFRGEIRIEHAEELTDDMSLDFEFSGGSGQVQRCVYICGGEHLERLHPYFSWQGFRYFTVEGEAENIFCEVIHTDLKNTAEFLCGNETINRVLDMYRRTQLMNIHGCVPSDCPHRERLGYTGDGQITCETVMHMFDARAMYEKWMQDIDDCRNINNGRIQHTAPFYGGGGGPAGWGGAAVVLPYTYYKMYGDGEFVKKYRETMTEYLDYMESRCENGLVTHEEAGGWCLGDWCFEGSCADYDGPLSPEFVNTCYLVKFYMMMSELAEILGMPREAFEEKIRLHKKAVADKYYSSETGDLCGNTLGSNAFGLDIGIGDKRTFDNLAAKYEKAGGFDTGIFGTEILVRVLCENGRRDIAFKLLSSVKEKHSFGYMLSRGATTLWEYWDGKNSHSQPMFGGCMKTLWTYFLGIRNVGTGFDKVVINPCDIKELGDMKGSLKTCRGTISAELVRRNGNIIITADIPEAVEARFEFGEISVPLPCGKSSFVI